MSELYMGVGRTDITPKIGGALYGYSPDIFSESINDALTATAFYFQQGDTEALIMSATVCAFNDAISEELMEIIEKKLGIPRQNCILHATHTHSAPNLMGNAGWGDVDREYCDLIFIPRMLEAAEKAKMDTRAVKMAVSSGESLVGVNRRQIFIDNTVDFGQCPWGAFDPRMTLISFADENRAEIANMIHYGCHGTAAGRNKQVTRDWSGVMTDVLEEKSGAVCAYLNGSEGDVGPRLANGKTTGEDDVSYALTLGGVAAADAVRIYNQPRCYHSVSLSVSSREIKIPLKQRITKEEAVAGYEKYSSESINISAAKKKYYGDVIVSYESGYTEVASCSFVQNVIRIGDVAFVGTPYEPFSEIGLRVSEQSKIPYVLTLSNSNGSRGYFVTEDQLCRGGYEVESFLTKRVQAYVDDADWYLIRETLDQLKTLKS